MDFEWDETKRLRTLHERSLDFRDAYRLFDSRPLYSYPSWRFGEDRVVDIGLLKQRLIAVVRVDGTDRAALSR